MRLDFFPELGDVLVERADAPRPPLLLFGAGHVGQAIAKAFEPLPFRLSWYDSRPETADIPGVIVLEPAELAAKAMGAGADAYYSTSSYWNPHSSSCPGGHGGHGQ